MPRQKRSASPQRQDRLCLVSQSIQKHYIYNQRKAAKLFNIPCLTPYDRLQGSWPQALAWRRVVLSTSTSIQWLAQLDSIGFLFQTAISITLRQSSTSTAPRTRLLPSTCYLTRLIFSSHSVQVIFLFSSAGIDVRLRSSPSKVFTTLTDTILYFI